jgi:hypothetical protein
MSTFPHRELVLDEVAVFLGEHYDHLWRLDKKIKDGFATPDKPIIIEKVVSEAERAECQAFSRVLKRHRWRGEAVGYSPRIAICPVMGMRQWPAQR